jgi:hypothetical protein
MSNMNEQLDILMDTIAQDFANRSPNRGEANREFRESLQVEEGRKYLKITKRLGTQTMVWGFIVKGDNDKLFHKGDILKAASWASPARNKARGNILRGDFSWVRWTGPGYL